MCKILQLIEDYIEINNPSFLSTWSQGTFILRILPMKMSLHFWLGVVFLYQLFEHLIPIDFYLMYLTYEDVFAFLVGRRILVPAFRALDPNGLFPCRVVPTFSTWTRSWSGKEKERDEDRRCPLRRGPVRRGNFHSGRFRHGLLRRPPASLPSTRRTHLCV